MRRKVWRIRHQAAGFRPLPANRTTSNPSSSSRSASAPSREPTPRHGGLDREASNQETQLFLPPAPASLSRDEDHPQAAAARLHEFTPQLNNAAPRTKQ